MKIIIVTGTPCAGKTTIAKDLADKLGFRFIDGNEIINRHSLKENYDRKRQCFVVDEKKFSKVLVEEIKKFKKEKISGIVIDSHMSHYLPANYVDLCVVAKCDLKILSHRLKKRGYSKSKIRENLDAEIFDICHIEAVENKHEVLLIDTSSSKKSADEIKSVIKLFNAKK